MKNIVFFRIPLVLFGLLCSGGQANYIFPISEKVDNMPNFAGINTFGSKPMPPMLFNMYTELYKSVNNLVELLLDSLTVPDTNTVKRSARNANTDRTMLPENIDLTFKSNNVTESQTLPNIPYLTISNSTPIKDRLINNNTKQNNDTYMNKFYNSSCMLPTCLEDSTIRKNSNQITRLVYIISAHAWNIYFMIKNYFSEQYNKIVNKLCTIYTTILPRSFIASIVSGLRKYWLLRKISADTITEDIVLYVALVVICGMMLFVALIVVCKLWNSRHKFKQQQEDVLLYVV